MRKTRVLVLAASLLAVCSVGRAGTIAHFDLDATDELNVYQAALSPGAYSISLRNGAYAAWSAWLENGPGQGWLNFYGVLNLQSGAGVYIENGLATPFADYDFNARLVFNTPEDALAADAPYVFTLSEPATVQIAIPDCPACFGDNRGGLSLTLAQVPEPSTFCLIACAFAGLGVAARRQAKRRFAAATAPGRQ